MAGPTILAMMLPRARALLPPLEGGYEDLLLPFYQVRARRAPLGAGALTRRSGPRFETRAARGHRLKHTPRQLQAGRGHASRRTGC
jgi:hypothetical protein